MAWCLFSVIVCVEVPMTRSESLRLFRPLLHMHLQDAHSGVCFQSLDSAPWNTGSQESAVATGVGKPAHKPRFPHPRIQRMTDVSTRWIPLPCCFLAKGAPEHEQMHIANSIASVCQASHVLKHQTESQRSNQCNAIAHGDGLELWVADQLLEPVAQALGPGMPAGAAPVQVLTRNSSCW